MVSCDKCGVIVYERNLEMIGHRFVCPSCTGYYTEQELNEYWTIQEQDELLQATFGGK